MTTPSAPSSPPHDQHVKKEKEGEEEGKILDDESDSENEDSDYFKNVVGDELQKALEKNGNPEVILKRLTKMKSLIEPETTDRYHLISSEFENKKEIIDRSPNNRERATNSGLRVAVNSFLHQRRLIISKMRVIRQLADQVRVEGIKYVLQVERAQKIAEDTIEKAKTKIEGQKSLGVALQKVLEIKQSLKN